MLRDAATEAAETAGGAERAIPDDLSLPDFLRRGTTSPRATAEARQSVAELPTYLLFGTTLGPQLGLGPNPGASSERVEPRASIRHQSPPP